MSGLSLLPIFMIGLLGSVHCIGMCGGIVGAFSVAPVPARKFPVAVVAAATVAVGLHGGAIGNALGGALRVACYNLGRIGSYAIAGALAGGFAAGASAVAGISIARAGGYWLANLMLVALGLYLMDAWRGLAHLEAAGQKIWRRIQPLTKLLMPLDNPLKLLLLGGLWGWLPCGMVYSVLLTAMLSGSAASGATVMLVFGLGTLPMLLAMGLLGTQLRNWMQRPPVRTLCGLLILGFGLLGLMRAANGLPMNWLDRMCVTFAAAGDR